MRHLGYVTNWNKEKGFGFVNSIADGQSYYMSKKVVGQDLCRGAIVEFEIGVNKEDATKTFARNVLVVEMPEERHNRY